MTRLRKMRVAENESRWQFGQDLVLSASRLSPLHDAFRTLFSPMEQSVAVEGGMDAAPLHLDLIDRPDQAGWYLCTSGLPLHVIEKENQIVPAVESLVTHLFARTQSRVQVLHTAMVGWGRHVVLLLGDRGSGKSTLSLWLAMNGADYYGDDLISYDPSTDSFCSLPKAVTLKIGSFPLFLESPTYEDPMRGAVRYSLPDTAILGRVPWADVACLVFPEYRRQGGEPQRLSSGWTALALVQQLLGGVEWNDQALQLVGRLAKLPAFRMPFNDLKGAGEFVQRIAMGDGACD